MAVSSGSVLAATACDQSLRTGSAICHGIIRSSSSPHYYLAQQSCAGFSALLKHCAELPVWHLMVLKIRLRFGQEWRCVPQQSVGVILQGQARTAPLGKAASTERHRYWYRS